MTNEPHRTAPNRIDLPLTRSEAMILWGLLDKVVQPISTFRPSASPRIELDRDENTQLGWVHNRLVRQIAGGW